jgi:hypothetical protein
MGGALARRAPGAGARAMLPGDVLRDGPGRHAERGRASRGGAAVADVGAAVHEYRAGSYPNFVEQPTDASALFDPDTWARLRDVKTRYDGDDLFAGNHHIPPAD